MSKSFFTGTDAQLYTGSKSFSTKITAQYASLGLTQAQCTSYAAKDTAYGTSYLAAVDPETRTKGKTAAKNSSRGFLRAAASDLAKIIDANPAVTDEQKIDLGLAVRRQPQPVPRPSTKPVVSVLNVDGNVVLLSLTSAVSVQGQPTDRARPIGVDGAAIFSAVAEEPPTTFDGWTFQGNTTKTKFSVSLPSSVAPGSKVYFIAYWFNRKKQSGDPSDPIWTVVQGTRMAKSA